MKRTAWILIGLAVIAVITLVTCVQWVDGQPFDAPITFDYPEV